MWQDLHYVMDVVVGCSYEWRNSSFCMHEGHRRGHAETPTAWRRFWRTDKKNYMTEVVAEFIGGHLILLCMV
jgi:hypothetical protein